MRNRGSILIIVLWTLFILGALAVAISGYVGARISVSAKLSERARNYSLARAGVVRAVLETRNDTTEKYDSLDDNWSNNDSVFKEARLGDGTYSVIPLSGTKSEGAPGKYGLSDEERKINVNKVSKDVLKSLLQIACEMDPESAGGIAASIVNWRNPADQAGKDGAGAFYYQTLEHPYECRNAPMKVPEELLLVKGVKPDIFNKVKPYITIYGSGAVNINTADAVVLRAICTDDALASKIIDFRKPASGANAGSGNADKTVFDDLSQVTGLLVKKESISAEESGKINNLIGAKLLSVTSDNFGGVVTGSIGGTTTAGAGKITFVFDRLNNAIRYWRE